MKTEANKAEPQDDNSKLDTTNATPKSAGGLDDIANTLADSMPEVQEHAINNEKVKNDAIKEKWADLRDVAGNPFDANIHKTNKQGEPTLSGTGKLIKRPKPKQPKESGSILGGAAIEKNKPQVVDNEAAAKLQGRASGKMVANLMLTLGVVVGGDEWQPMQDKTSGLDEKEMLETAFADYFEATGKTDIPAGMALTVAIGGYMLPRFLMPKTQTRLGRVKSWFIQKLADRKLRKHGLKSEKMDK